jgi:hypothetical protein
MTIDDQTLGPGVNLQAVTWLAPQRCWGPPTEVACTRLARLSDLSDDELAALDTPALATSGPNLVRTIKALYPPGRTRQWPG